MKKEVQDSGGHPIFYVHLAVFLLITFGMGFLPAPGLPPQGMKILGVFLGLVYGWTFLSFTWPSMVCLLALGFTGYATPTEVLVQGFANPVVLFVIFILIFTSYCNQSGLNELLAKWVISRRIFAGGHPWLFAGCVLIGAFISSFLVDPVPVVFLFFSILYTMFKDIGFKKGDNYPAYLLVGVCVAGCLSALCKPWNPQNLPGITALKNISGGAAVIDNVTLIVVAFPACIVALLLFVLAVRFMLRPDVKQFSNLTPEYLAKLRGDLRMGKKEGVAAAAVFAFLCLMLLPNLLPSDWASMKFLNLFALGTGMILILSILSIIRIDHKPVFDFQSCSEGINWNVIWMFASSIPVSSALGSPEAGLEPLIKEFMGSYFSSGSSLLTLVLFMICVNLITQFAHNVAVIIAAAPIVWNLSQTAGFNPVGFYLLVILSAGIAFVTPTASIIGAISFSNGEWIGVQRAFKVGFIGNFICLGCLIALGLPLVLLLVGI